MDDIIKLAYEKISLLNIEINSVNDLDFFLNQATENLKILLNVDEIPENAKFLLSDMVAGLFLKNHLFKNGESSGNIRSIKEGDVSLSYSSGSSLWEMAVELAEPSEYKLASFRRILW